MSPKLEHGRMAVVPQTPVVQQRSTRIQTSGIFRLPLELFFEIFSYFTDHRQFIRENFYGRELGAYVDREHAERSIVIRRLTMTCWPLRNLLLPFLWADAEGCISHTRYDYKARTGGSGYSLYAQCVYLISNPTIAPYVQTFSVDLYFWLSPGNLVSKFIDCLLQLSNLRTLEILGASSGVLVSTTLKQKRATFPSIRTLRIAPVCHHFIESCPNVEDVTFTARLNMDASATIQSHGIGLKRIAGVDVYNPWGLDAVSSSCPNLREIGIIGSTRSKIELIKDLRQLKHLAIVEVDLEEERDRELPQGVWEKARETWKRELLSLLEDNPLTDPKILRWKIVQSYRHPRRYNRVYDVMEAEELEAFPGTSL